MMGEDERTRIGLVIVVATLGLVAASFVMPWWTFEQSTGRQVAPDGPSEETGVENGQTRFYPPGWRGDIQPTEMHVADNAMQLARIAVYAATGACLLYLLGQLPGVSRIITRPWCMALAGVAGVGLIAALATAWVYLPGSMESLGAEGPFTAKLLEDGYIRSHLDVGWLAAALAAIGSIGAFLAAYSAGDADPRTIEEFGVPT